MYLLILFINIVTFFSYRSISEESPPVVHFPASILATDSNKNETQSEEKPKKCKLLQKFKIYVKLSDYPLKISYRTFV